MSYHITKLIKGPQATYVSGGSGSDYTVLESFKTAYPDWPSIVYFATDTQTLWMNGKPYGISGQSLQFMSTVVTSADTSGNVLILTTYDSTKPEGSRTGTIDVPLTTMIKDPSSAIVVTKPTGTDTDYVIGLTVDGKTITQNETTGLSATLTLAKSSDGKNMYLTDSTGSRVGSSIDVSNFLTDSFLSDAEIVTQDASGDSGKYLKLTVTYVDNPQGLTGETFYIDLNDYFNNYTGGNGINVSSTGEGPVLSLKLNATWLGFDSNGNLVDTSLNSKIEDLSTKIHDLSVNTDNIVATANSEVINNLRGSVDSSWQDTSANSQTIWAVKKYADSSTRTAINNVIGQASDTSTRSTIYGAKAYADSKIAQFHASDDTSIAAETADAKSKVFTKLSIEDGSFSPTESITSNVGDLHLAGFTLTDDTNAPSLTTADEITTGTTINNAVASILKSMCWIDLDASA